MPSEWEWSTLGNEALNASRPFMFAGHPTVIFVNTGDVLSGKFLHANRSSANTLPGQAKKALRPHDILLTEIRPGNGRYAYVDFDAGDYVVSTKFMVIESKGRLLPRFLYHLLTNQRALDEFQRIAESRSGTFPQVTFDSISHFPIPVPGHGEQQQLAKLFDLLQARIDLLRQTNITLESIAQTLFKSWFIDFDPVRAKQAGRKPEGMDAAVAALFPAEFEDSPMGPVPAGWSIKTIDELAARVGMGPFGSNIKVSTFVDTGVPVLSGACLAEPLLEDVDFKFITEHHAERLAGSVVQAGDIVITHRGTLGQVSLVPNGSAYPAYVLSQSQFFLRANLAATTPEFLTYFLRSPLGQHLLLANAAQVGVPSISRPVTNLRAIQLVAPSPQVARAFGDTVSLLHRRIVAGRSQRALLGRLRDTLLPRLISGKLRLPEAQEQLEDALA